MKIELSVVNTLAVLKLATFCCEFAEELMIDRPKGFNDSQYHSLIVQKAVNIDNAFKALKSIDEDDSLSPLLSLHRDGVRWKDR